MLNLWHNYSVLAGLPQERDRKIEAKIKTEMGKSGNGRQQTNREGRKG